MITLEWHSGEIYHFTGLFSIYFPHNMSVYMAADVYRYRKTRDMSGIGLNIYRKSSDPASKTPGAYPQIVDLIHHLFFKLSNMIYIRMPVYGTGKCLFCQNRTFFEGSADTYSDYHRRTGIGTCFRYCLKYRILNSFNAVSGF